MRRTDDIRVRHNWRKGATYVTVFMGILILGRIWFAGFQSLTTYLGLVSAGIAIALKDPQVNLAAWASILWRRPFTEMLATTQRMDTHPTISRHIWFLPLHN